MQLTSLDTPDSGDWRDHRHYDPEAARVLRDAFTLLREKSDSLETYREVVERLAPYLDVTLAQEQAARVRYGIFRAFSAVGNHAQAIAYLDEVNELCTATANMQSLAEASWWQSVVCLCLAHNSEAFSECQTGVALVRGLYAGDRPRLPLLELKLLIDGAFAALFLERLEAAEAYLAQAATLLAQIKAERALGALARKRRADASGGELVLLEARLAWARALHLRRQGSADQAAQQARAAADIYVSLGAPISAARAQVLAAEITMDHAEQHGHPLDRHAELEMAAWRLKAATALAGEAVDTGTTGQVTLARARLSRMRGERADRLTPVGQIVEQAWQASDIPGVAQAYMDLGDEYAQRGEPGVAEVHYVWALDALRLSEAAYLRPRALQRLNRVRR